LPLNLGPTVNTVYDDDAPFLHPDGVTLYFSSKGHNTMGEYDVFKSIYDTEQNKFNGPENLGYPINDVGSDIFFVLSVDGQRGYYSSMKKESLGGIDIYQIDTRFSENDLRVRLGTATAEGTTVRAKVTLTDPETKDLIGYYNTNPSNGRILLIVNPLKSYEATVEADGYETQKVKMQPLAKENGDGYFEFKLKKTDAH
jgi:hypothetical protein